ncbi:MAG: single-stranded DNA-binding protein [bacterium]
MDLNKAMIIGRLTRDPEIKTTPSGQTVATFSVATSLKWKDANGVMQERSEFHNIVAWRKLAEICGQYLVKGKKIYLEGRLQTRDWTGQDGVKRYRTEIIAGDMIMLDGAKPGGQANYQNNPVNSNASPNNTEPQVDNSANNQVSEEEIQVEDIPF